MASESVITLQDDLGDTIELGGPPERIVSLVPSITESIIELGAGRRLAGVTNYCIHPAAAVAPLPKVGGTKGFSLEKIEALVPDLVIANREENRKHQIDALRARYPVFVSYPRTVAGALKMLGDLGTLTATRARADRCVDACRTLIAAAPGANSPLRTACLIWRGPWMAAGPDTYMSNLLAVFGLQNVFDDAGGRYPEVTLDAVFDRAPEALLLPDEPYAFGEPDRGEIERAARARRSRVRVYCVDGSYLTWFGTRTKRALRYLAGLRRRLDGAA